MRFGARSLVFFALICVVGVVHQWVDVGGGIGEGNTAIPYWRYLAALFIAGVGYEWYSSRTATITVRIDAPDSLRLGREETISITLHNDGWRGLNFECVAGLPADIEFEEHSHQLQIAPGAKATLALRVTGTDIGQREWKTLPGRLRGALGLVWWPRSLVLDTTLYIVPDLLGNRHGAPGVLALGDKASHPGSGLELHHLREYVSGDPLRTINWKATARSQRLITQVFSEEQHLEIMLVLDLGRTSRTRIDGMSQFSHYVNLASTFAQLALASGDYVGLLAVSDRTLVALPPSRGAPAMTRISAALRELKPEPVETDILNAALQVQKLARNRCLVVFVTDLYGQSLAGDFGRSLRLWSERHLPFVVGLIGEEVSELMHRPAERAADAYTSLAANEYCNAVEANASAARRLGAQAIVARPAELQTQVLNEYQILKAQHRI